MKIKTVCISKEKGVQFMPSERKGEGAFFTSISSLQCLHSSSPEGLTFIRQTEKNGCHKLTPDKKSLQRWRKTASLKESSLSSPACQGRRYSAPIRLRCRAAGAEEPPASSATSPPPTWRARGFLLISAPPPPRPFLGPSTGLRVSD